MSTKTPVTMQVIYPVSENSTFDHDYYVQTHMALVAEHMGSQISSTLVTKGLSGGPKTAAPYHAIATIVFPDQDAMNTGLGSGHGRRGELYQHPPTSPVRRSHRISWTP